MDLLHPVILGRGVVIVPKSYQQEGLSITYAKRLVLDFGSSNPEGSLFFFPFSKFLSLVSFFRVRLYSVRVRVSVSLTRLSFQLVRLGTRAIVVTSEPFRKSQKACLRRSTKSQIIGTFTTEDW